MHPALHLATIQLYADTSLLNTYHVVVKYKDPYILDQYEH